MIAIAICYTFTLSIKSALDMPLKAILVMEIPAKEKEVLRVAAYCRVSTAYEEQQSSFENGHVYENGKLIVVKRELE